jgi:hypothetical protein
MERRVEVIETIGRHKTRKTTKVKQEEELNDEGQMDGRKNVIRTIGMRCSPNQVEHLNKLKSDRSVSRRKKNK